MKKTTYIYIYIYIYIYYTRIISFVTLKLDHVIEILTWTLQKVYALVNWCLRKWRHDLRNLFSNWTTATIPRKVWASFSALGLKRNLFLILNYLTCAINISYDMVDCMWNVIWQFYLILLRFIHDFISVSNSNFNLYLLFRFRIRFYQKSHTHKSFIIMLDEPYLKTILSKIKKCVLQQAKYGTSFAKRFWYYFKRCSNKTLCVIVIQFYSYYSSNFP